MNHIPSPKTAITLFILSTLLLILTNPIHADTKNTGYSEPTIKCKNPDYYSIFVVEDEKTKNPKIIQGDGCDDVDTIEVNKNQGCAAVGGDQNVKDAYKIIKIPVCSTSLETLAKEGFDLLGKIETGRKPPKTNVPYPATIDRVLTKVDLDTNNIDINIFFTNTGDKESSYKVCVYGTTKTLEESLEEIGGTIAGVSEAACNTPLGMIPPFSIACTGKEAAKSAAKEAQETTQPTTEKTQSEEKWNLEECSNPVTVKPKETASILISSNKGILDFLKVLGFGWDVEDLNGRIKVALYSTTGEETLVDEVENAVCQDNVMQLCFSQITPTQPVYGVLSKAKFEGVAVEEVSEDVQKYYVLDKREHTLMHTEDCSTTDPNTGIEKEKKFYVVANNDKYIDYVKQKFEKEEFYQKYKNLYGEIFTALMYCYKTELRGTDACKEYNNFWYSLSADIEGRYRESLTEYYLNETYKWNLNQNITEIISLDKGIKQAPVSYNPQICAVSFNKDYYLPGEEITVKYSNAPKDCTIKVTGISGEANTVSGSGEIKYTAPQSKTTAKVSLSCGYECYSEDDALIQPTALSNIMSKAFMITPLVEDVRGNSRWTKTGNATFFAGNGFERYDTCALSCDAKRDCNLHEGCTNAMGATDECSTCDDKYPDYTPQKCTRDSKDTCPGEEYDCWNKICKVKARPFALEAPVGGTDFYGIPYKDSCPEGFSLNEVLIHKHNWITAGSKESSTQREQICQIPNAILGITTLEFSPPENVDIAFLIDTSPSMQNEWKSLCNIIENVVTSSAEKGVKITYTIYGLGDKTPDFASGCKNMVMLPCTKLNTDLYGVIDCLNCKYDGCKTESWGAAIIWAAKKHQWKGNSKKLIIPISDEDCDCGDEGGSDGNNRIKQAAAMALTTGAKVYGLYGEEANSPQTAARKQMEEIAKETGGEATLFSDQATMTNWFIKIATETSKTPYAIANDKEIKWRPLDSDKTTWEFYQDEETESVDPKTGEKQKIKPSLHLIETGNMPFEILYAKLIKEDNKYKLIKIYLPKEPERRFTAKTDIDFNYTVFENAESLNIEINTTYRTTLRRDKYYTSCLKYPCECRCESIKYNFNLIGGAIDSCGGISRSVPCQCKYDDEGDCISCSPNQLAASYRREIETETVDIEYNERDNIHVPGVSKKKLCGDTLKKVKIEGILQQNIDEEGTLTIYTKQEQPLKITVSPDILAGFKLDVNKSYVVYNALIYPIRHSLLGVESSVAPEAEWSNYEDNYGKLRKEFVPEQCKKTCPSEPLCSCPPENVLNPKCVNIYSPHSGMINREDCACVARGCYPDACDSERNYHEWEGSVIANGDFESGSIAPFTGDGTIELQGFSGHMLKLNGKVEQNIPSIHVKPYNQLCLEYAINEHKKEGVFNLIITLNNKENKHNIWTYSEDCGDCTGWKKKCLPVEGKISKIVLESNVEVYVDNINIGRYYDFVAPYTYETDRLEYMDTSRKPWNSLGLLRTDWVSHDANSYYFPIRTYARDELDARNEIMESDVAEAIEELNNGKKDIVSAFLKTKGVEISDSATVSKGVGDNWKITDGNRAYKIYKSKDGNKLGIYFEGRKKVAFSVEDFRGGALTISTFYGDLTIPLKENTREGEKCYEVDLTFKEPSKIKLETNPKGYAIPRGTEVEVTATLTTYKGEPLAGEKLYVSLEGADIWEDSPTGLSPDYTFNYNEIAANKEQQENLINLLLYLGYRDTAESIKDAKYKVEKEGLLNITNPGGGEIAVIEAKPIEDTPNLYKAVMKTGCDEEIELGIINNKRKNSPPYSVYETTDRMKSGYMITDVNGKASFKFKPHGTTISVGYYGEKASPTQAKTTIGTVKISSPLLSGEFLVLALILVFTVFSYRFFIDKRIDLYSWWRDFKGKK